MGLRFVVLGCGLAYGVSVVADDGAEIRRVVVIHFDTTRVDDWRCYGGSHLFHHFRFVRVYSTMNSRDSRAGDALRIIVKLSACPSGLA